MAETETCDRKRKAVSSSVFSDLTDCRICLQPAVDAFQCTQQHVICASCRTEMLKKAGSKCPMKCGLLLVLFVPARTVRTLLESVDTECASCVSAVPQTKPFVGTKSEIDEHVKMDCPGASVTCTRQWCHEKIERQHMNAHMLNNCEWRPLDVCPISNRRDCRTSEMHGETLMNELARTGYSPHVCIPLTCVHGCGLLRHEMVVDAQTTQAQIEAEIEARRDAYDAHVSCRSATAALTSKRHRERFPEASHPAKTSAATIDALDTIAIYNSCRENSYSSTQIRNFTDTLPIDRVCFGSCMFNKVAKKMFFFVFLYDTDPTKKFDHQKYCICGSRATVCNTKNRSVPFVTLDNDASPTDVDFQRDKTGVIFRQQADILCASELEKRNVYLDIFVQPREHCVRCMDLRRKERERKEREAQAERLGWNPGLVNFPLGPRV